MQTLNAAELEGPLLDWAVAKVVGLYVEIYKATGRVHARQVDASILGVPCQNCFYGAFGHGSVAFSPTSYWLQGGPIIEKYSIPICPVTDGTWGSEYVTFKGGDDEDTKTVRGPTPLVAAMRAFVLEHLGENIEVPV